MSLAITIVEKVNLGSVQGVIFDAEFTDNPADGEAFTPALVGLQNISILTVEPSFIESGDHEFSVSYNKPSNKLTLLDAGAEATGSNADATVRCLAIGR